MRTVLRNFTRKILGLPDLEMHTTEYTPTWSNNNIHDEDDADTALRQLLAITQRRAGTRSQKHRYDRLISLRDRSL